MALFAVARRAISRGPIVEIGGYLGRSTLFLAAAVAARRGGLVYSVDHHRGSEEMQPGWPDHNPAVVDARTGAMDSLQHFRLAISSAGANEYVVTVVGDSRCIAEHWRCRAGLVLIDGGHGSDVCWGDYRGWAPRVVADGFLVFHDVFPDPSKGGRPPFECYRDAVSGGRFVEDRRAGRGSLRVLRARTAGR